MLGKTLQQFLGPLRRRFLLRGFLLLPPFQNAAAVHFIAALTALFWIQREKGLVAKTAPQDGSAEQDQDKGVDGPKDFGIKTGTDGWCIVSGQHIGDA